MPITIAKYNSDNKGFKHHVSSGEISKEVANLVESCEKIKRYNEWL